jgi:hypothetical protein
MKEEKEKDKLENITGSGIEVTIKGKEYKLGIFGMRDLADFRQYIKGQRIKIIQATIVSMEEKLILINSILDSNVNETKELQTMDGVTFMLWRSLKKYQPELTLADVDDMIDLDNISEISNVLMNIGGKVKNSQKRAKKV